jgi:hypothetical protein
MLRENEPSFARIGNSPNPQAKTTFESKFDWSHQESAYSTWAKKAGEFPQGAITSL